MLPLLMVCWVLFAFFKVLRNYGVCVCLEMVTFPKAAFSYETGDERDAFLLLVLVLLQAW